MSMFGGWSEYRDLTPEDKAVFDKAMEAHLGMTFEPYAVSTQVVAGTNYKFRCTGTTVTQNPEESDVVVKVFKGLDNKLELIEIVTIETYPELMGGLSPFRKLTPEDKAVFDKALEGHCGMIFEPYAVSTQQVSGTNYRFRCNTETVTNPPVFGDAIVEVYVDLQGNITLGKITKVND